MTTGFQMIVHRNASSKMYELYTDKAVNRQVLASVEVEESGMYQVTIFAIKGERGILNSNVEYRTILAVVDDDTITGNH